MGNDPNDSSKKQQDDTGTLPQGMIVSGVKGLGDLIPGVSRQAAEYLGHAVYHALNFANEVSDDLVDTS